MVIKRLCFTCTKSGKIVRFVLKNCTFRFRDYTTMRSNSMGERRIFAGTTRLLLMAFGKKVQREEVSGFSFPMDVSAAGRAGGPVAASRVSGLGRQERQLRISSRGDRTSGVGKPRRSNGHRAIGQLV